MFYHGSRVYFRSGDWLAPRANGYVQRSEGGIEALFEARRPKGKISRFDAVFLVEDPNLIDAAGGYSDAVYEVLPYAHEGDDKIDLQCSDLAWYSDVFCLLDSEPAQESDARKIQAQIEVAIDAYWAGTHHPSTQVRCQEYRARGAEVFRMAECNVDLDELEDPRVCSAYRHGVRFAAEG